jgi:hypothetical protein
VSTIERLTRSKRLTVEQIPIEHTVINVAVVLHDLCEQFPEKVIIRCFFESQLPDVIQIDPEFLWTTIVRSRGWKKFADGVALTRKPVTELLDKGRLLLLTDLLIFLLVCSSFESLPRKASS